MKRQLELGGQCYDFDWWQGEPLRGTADRPLSFDSETERIRPVREPLEGESVDDIPNCPLHVPRPALAMAFAGDCGYLIHPQQLSKFFAVHRGQHFCSHNIQFDFWVCFKHSDRATQEVLWSIGDRNGWHCTQTLDLLLQLATGKYRIAGNSKYGEDVKIYPTNLGVLTEQYGCGSLDKTDPYRLRFGELLGLSATEMDSHPEADGFFSYAIKDVIATWSVYQKQREQGLALMRKAGWSPNPKQKTYEMRPDAVEKFGVMSESLQVNAAIALAELSRTPIRIHQEKRAAAEAASRERYQQALDRLLAIDKEIEAHSDTAGSLVKVYKVKKRAGEQKLTKKSLLPQFNQKRLVAILESEAARLNVDVLKSEGKLKGTSTSAKAWVRFADQSEFIAAWVELESEAKSLEFLTTLAAPEVYSNYNLLKRTGRVSAEAHRRNKQLLLPSVNIQQIPRDNADNPERSIRSLFLPPVGMKWFSCDYGYIELRALAARCRAVFGWSKLGEVIEEHTKRGGADPHQMMAASMLGITVEEFFKLDKKVQKKSRQSGKAVGFGYPGGLGVATFRVYAKSQYGADFTVKEAKEAKKKWLELYPEMKLHLEDKTHQAMEWQSGKKQARLGWVQKKRMSDFLRGDDKTRAKFSEEETAMIWDRLGGLAYAKNDEQVIEDVENRKVTNRVRELIYYRACTLTGRIRNNVKFSDHANSVFQGLAADGAKLALWRLLRRGFRLLAFIHDAFDVAVDPRQAQQQCKQIEKIMVESMEFVLGQGIPVACEGELAECWSKA